MIRAILLIKILLLVVACASREEVQTNSGTLKASVIKERMVEELLSNPDPEWASAEFLQWKAMQRKDGSFSDLDYVDLQKSNWGPIVTLSRALVLLQASLTPKNKLYQSVEAQTMAMDAIRFLSHKKWWNYNWWIMEIGMPRAAGRILLLSELMNFDENLKYYVEQILEKGHIDTHPSGWPAEGQNLVWYAENTLVLGLYKNEPQNILRARNAIEGELTVGKRQGIQEDDSFHQHGKLFYTGGYGLDFALDCARFIKLLFKTEWGFSDRARFQFARYLYSGVLWQKQGKILDYSALGRTYARPNAASSAKLDRACEIMGNCVRPIGLKHFWKSDFLVYNQKDFGISVRMHSTRTLNGDTSPNGEGLRSHFLADGLTYINRTGDEYFNIHPVWDYNYLPGVTAAPMKKYPHVTDANYWPSYGTTSFVGGVSDGVKGLAVMDFAREQVKGQKAWFFHLGTMVAMGTGFDCAECMTTVNQEYSKGPILIPGGGFNSGVKLLSIPWAHANGVGYLFPGSPEVRLSKTHQIGNWKKIAIQLSDAVVEEEILSLSIPTKDKYLYAVYPGIEVTKLAEAQNFEVLQNDGVQAIRWSDGTLMASLPKGGELGKLKVDRAVALILDKDKLTLASPAQETGTVRVSVTGCPELRLELPKEAFAGSPVSLTNTCLSNP